MSFQGLSPQLSFSLSMVCNHGTSVCCKEIFFLNSFTVRVMIPSRGAQLPTSWWPESKQESREGTRDKMPPSRLALGTSSN